MVGHRAGHREGLPDLVRRAVVALLVALLLQIGVNYANTTRRHPRAPDDHASARCACVGSGRPRRAEVLAAALGSFAAAAILGLTLVIRHQAWWILLVGARPIAAAGFYTERQEPVRLPAALGEAGGLLFRRRPRVGHRLRADRQLSWTRCARLVWPIGHAVVLHSGRQQPARASSHGPAGKRTLAVGAPRDAHPARSTPPASPCPS
ncbi:hypothetical protein [Nonomuraea dietziae]|uniref:hypothetical protein n=1 Tax=Nonomuraea dietziae TaxID=65515 RepID=UPI0031D6ED4B